MEKLSLAVITEVNHDKSFFKASIDAGDFGSGGFPQEVRFAYSGYSYKNGSGILYMPEIGDNVVLANISGTYIPLSFFAPVCYKENDSGETRKNDVGEDETVYTQWETLKDPEKDETLNWSAGRRKLLPGSGAILGAKGKNGIIVFPNNRLEVFASDLVKREYLESGDNSKITDRTIEYFLGTTSYMMQCQRTRKDVGKTKAQASLDRSSTSKNQTKNVVTRQRFYLESGFEYDPIKNVDGYDKTTYFEIISGHMEDYNDVFRVEALRFPKEAIDKKTSNKKSEDGAQKDMGDIGGNTPIKIAVKSKGRQDKSKTAVIYKRDGKYILSSIDIIEFQGQKRFNVFVETEEEVGVGFYTNKNVEIYSDKKCDIIGKEEIVLGTKELEAKIKGGKFTIGEASSSGQGAGLPKTNIR